MAKTVSLCSAPLFLGLILISSILMTSQGVNGFTICFDDDLNWWTNCEEYCRNNYAPLTFLSSHIHNIFSFSPTKCACCYDDGNNP
ncbi:hypothetical protein MKX03_024738 [Papaver bracteatum]|nr:hypothetical protein MKX03_024738 [Papaver bracteatum]